MAPAEGADSAWIRSGIRSGGPGRIPAPPILLNTKQSEYEEIEYELATCS